MNVCPNTTIILLSLHTVLPDLLKPSITFACLRPFLFCYSNLTNQFWLAILLSSNLTNQLRLTIHLANVIWTHLRTIWGIKAGVSAYSFTICSSSYPVPQRIWIHLFLTTSSGWETLLLMILLPTTIWRPNLFPLFNRASFFRSLRGACTQSILTTPGSMTGGTCPPSTLAVCTMAALVSSTHRLHSPD